MSSASTGQRGAAGALVVERGGAVAGEAPEQAAGDPERGSGQQVAVEIVTVVGPHPASQAPG